MDSITSKDLAPSQEDLGARVGDVAIVGCGLRLPGNLKSLDELWAFLLEGGDGIRDIPTGRWLQDLYDPQRRDGWTYVTRAGWIDGLDQIDASFIGCSPKEAMQMDPQQRILIETAYEALENAGIPLSTLSTTRTGVFVGISSNDYGQLMNEDRRRGNAYTNTGGALSIAANRISYVFDLRGPSIAIDTACSSGLTAFDFAVRSMRQGSCEVAIVGAANALFKPEPFAGFCGATMLSPAGQCRAFDADGQGFVRAEGAVSFILKPLEAAVRDNNPILGVVRGSDTNNDGRTGGISLPSSEAQSELIQRVFKQYGLSADDVAYVEAHGTGTAAGDPIEAGAIGRSIACMRGGVDPLVIGSIKSNIGHLEPASGLAGLAKAILCLKHRMIPQSLHFDTPNPAIDFDGLRIKVANEVVPMADTSGPTLVCVNSFGFGGANAHVVLAEAPESRPQVAPEPEMERPWIMVSGRSPEAMRASAERLSTYLGEHPDVTLGEFCGNLLTRRSWHNNRTAISADSIANVRKGLDNVAAEREAPNIVSGTSIPDARTAFVFTGNGPQWWGMGRGLYSASKVFKATIEEIDAEFRAVSGLQLIDEMFREEADSRMAMTEVAQPALFALQVGLVRALAEDGLRPDATFGHSAGELAAAYCAGAFDLETIVRVVSARSRQQEKTAGNGAMAAIGFGVEKAEGVIKRHEGLVIAGDNGPDATSIAGPVASIDALVSELKDAGTFATKLRLNYAFHSPAMDPIEEGFRELVRDVKGTSDHLPFFSTVTGERIDGSQMDVDYWWGNLRKPVLFRPAVTAMCEAGYGVFVEVGPHPNLVGYVKAAARAGGQSVRTVETLRRGENEPDQRRKAVAAAAVAGSAIDLSEIFPAPVPVLPDLPTYAWQHERQFNSPWPRAMLSALPTSHPYLGPKISLGKDVWSQDIALSRVPSVADHVIRGGVLFPAAGFLETAVAAAQSAGLEGQIELRSVKIEKAFAIDREREFHFQTFLDRTDHGLTIRSRPIAVGSGDPAERDDEPYTEHMRAVIESRPDASRVIDLDAIGARMKYTRAPAEHYALTSARGLNYGPTFQTVDNVEVGEGEVLATLTRRTDGSAFTLDPTQVDGALQAMIGLIEIANDRRLFVPVELDRLVVRGSTRDHETILAHIVTRGANRFYLSADVMLAAPDGTVIAELHGIQVRSVGAGTGLDAMHMAHELSPLVTFHDTLSAIALDGLISTEPQSTAAAHRRVIKAAYNRDIEEMCHAFTADTFFGLSDGAPFTLDGLVSDGLLAAGQVRYADLVLARAAAAGFVEQDGDTYRVPVRPDARSRWDACIRAYPAYAAEVIIAGRIWAHLPALLRGEGQLLQILFPGAGSRLMEQVYDQGFTSIEPNEALAASIAKLVDTLPEGRRLRILEVGGGTGGTTGHILGAIDSSRVEYVFTDISPDFLARAERRFGQVPTFSSAVLDFTKPNDLEPHGGPFDLIVAANALHVTPAVKATLQQLKSFLRPNGILGLVEIERHGYFDFFFGMLDGVWLFENDPDRADHALLSGEAWTSLLADCGFADVALWDDADSESPSTCSMILARNTVDEGTGAAAVTGGTASAAAAKEPAQSWLLVKPAGDDAYAAEFAATVRASGGTVTTFAVTTEDGPADPAADRTIGIDDIEAWDAACLDLKAAAPQRIVAFAPRKTVAEVPRSDNGWALVALLNAVNKAGWPAAPRLDIVTENVLGSSTVDVAGGGMWAVGRVVVNEQPNWNCRRIDCDGSEAARERLAAWLTGQAPFAARIGADVDELRFTADGVYANLIEPVGAVTEHAAAPDAPFAITLKAQGSIDNIMLRELPATPAPDEGMVEIALRTAGVNFKDVILALGMLPPELLKDSVAGPMMGLEGAGVVSRVGPGVTELAVGDEVMLMSEGCFASHITVPEHAAKRVPAGWSLEEAATLPVVGLTVAYALDFVARLRPGETFLVHGGAGGIGLMAIQYAKALGARVIATAGSQEKRELLDLLGVDFISDSRTLRFEDDIRTFTNGAGVDVVLNSLAGDAMLASLDVLKPFGRFVEIGKRDFEANNRINLRALENNISYFAVDLTYLPHQRPDLFVETWERLREVCELGAVRPLPFRSYPLANLKEGLRLMQSGRHIGKLVIDLDRKATPVTPLPRPATTFSIEGVHVVTGGLGGIGLKLGRFMAERGATAIALIGRKGVTTDEQREAIAGIEALGARVDVVQADVSDGPSVEALVADLVERHGSIRSVMHAVLVLDDSLMMNLTHEAFEQVNAPKVQGAYHFDRLTRGQPLEAFVTFSSLANVVGNPGQASYVAANAYLEQIVLARQAEGLPGLALELGAVGDAGILARDEKVRQNLNQTIGATISTADILDALEGFLSGGPAVVAVTSPAVRIGGPVAQTARLAAFPGQGGEGASGDKIDFNAVAIEERAALMEQVLVQALASVMGAKESRIDTERSLMESGLDSLMAVEFAMTVEQRIGASVPTSELTKDRSLRELAVALLLALNVEVGEAAAAEAEAPETDLLRRDIQLADDYRVTTPAPEVPVAERNAILLTGVTGFLGAFLLEELLSKGAKRVICLCRGRTPEVAARRVVRGLQKADLGAADHVGKEVEIWTCDLGADGLGLTEEQRKIIEDDVDLIIHSAADVNFLGGYEEMRAPNVESVRQLLEIARVGRPKAFQFISTLRIFARVDQIEQEAITEQSVAWFPPQSEGGYVKSKWAADMLVLEAKARGLAAGIHRPSFVIGRTTDGFTNVTDIGATLARFAFDSGMLPKVEVSLPMISVDTAARRIVSFIDTPGEQVGTYHITDWPALTMNDIKVLMEAHNHVVDLYEIDTFLEKSLEFFEKNPGHPAIWLPMFFASTNANNALGSKLRTPILPAGEVMDADEAKRTIDRMGGWFAEQERLAAPEAAL